MPKLSRAPVDPEHMGRFINNLWSSITLLESKEEVKEFLRDFLSHTETKMLAKRLQIAKMLSEGKNYQEIKDALKVQTTTIARTSNKLQTSESGALLRVVEKLTEMEEEERGESISQPRRTAEPSPARWAYGEEKPEVS